MDERTPALDVTVRSAPALEDLRREELAAFEKTAGIRFKSIELLNLSFIHRSTVNETGQRADNERLEFLGDAVLGAAAAELLYSRLAGKPEGDLAKAKSVVVSEASLAERALELGIDAMLVLGRGEANSGGRTKPAILADAFEALIGAYFLDSGYSAAAEFIASQLGPEIDRVLANRHQKDYKTLLQELSQRLYRRYPDYRLIKKSGPDHARIFWMDVTVEGVVYGPGQGVNKKAAEQDAARQAYEALNPDPAAP
jgi:ribonuclease-3